jgi:mRNA interferase HicA
VKRSSLLQHLRRHGCNLKREGGAHSLWINPATGAVEAIPRHTEIAKTWHRRKQLAPDACASSCNCRSSVVPIPRLQQSGSSAMSTMRISSDFARRRASRHLVTTEKSPWIQQADEKKPSLK